MQKIISICTLLILAVAPAAFAQDKLYNHVDQPANINYSHTGSARVPISPTGSIISLDGYTKVSIRIGSTQATSMSVVMGKIAGRTLAKSFNFPVNRQIITLDVVGPELAINLSGGPPNTKEKVQLWVYLHH